MDPKPYRRDFADDVALIRRAQQGNRMAFDRLACRYRDELVGLAFGRLGNREAAEDLVQDVLARAWQKLLTLQDPFAFPAWLHTITVNACRMQLRRHVPASEPIEDEDIIDPGPDPLEAVLAGEQRAHWREALLGLAEENRHALVLHIWGHYPYEEIARRLGVPLTTVEGRIYRAKVQLRRALGVEASQFLTEAKPLPRKEDTR